MRVQREALWMKRTGKENRREICLRKIWKLGKQNSLCTFYHEQWNRLPMGLRHKTIGSTHPYPHPHTNTQKSSTKYPGREYDMEGLVLKRLFWEEMFFSVMNWNSLHKHNAPFKDPGTKTDRRSHPKILDKHTQPFTQWLGAKWFAAWMKFFDLRTNASLANG